MTSKITGFFSNTSKQLHFSLSTIDRQRAISSVTGVDHFGENCLDPSFLDNESKVIAPITEANRFLSEQLESVVFFGENISIGPYFSKRLTDDLVPKITVMNLLWNSNAVSDSACIMWSLFNQCKLPFSYTLFRSVLQNVMFGGADIPTQLNAALGVMPATPSGMPETGRLVAELANTFQRFIKTTHKQRPYDPAAQKFACNQPGQGGDKLEFSLHNFMGLFRTIGVHGALYLDAAVLSSIRTNIQELVQIFLKLGPTLEKLGTGPNPDMQKASGRLLRAAVGITVRQLIRRAIELVTQETAPGLPQLTEEAHEGEMIWSLIQEAMSSRELIFFMELTMRGIIGSKASQMKRGAFGYFLGMATVGAKWNAVQFLPDENAVSLNLHLIPKAVGLLMQLYPAMVEGAKRMGQVIPLEADTYMMRLHEMLQAKKKDSNWSEETSKAYLIVASGFAQVPIVGSGALEKYFPLTLIQSAYPRSK